MSQRRQFARGNLPIKHGAAERTSTARTAEEEVPDSVGELRSLRVGAEDRVGASAAERDHRDLALRLASLDGGREELAVGEICAREGSVVPIGACLQRARWGSDRRS